MSALGTERTSGNERSAVSEQWTLLTAFCVNYHGAGKGNEWVSFEMFSML